MSESEIRYRWDQPLEQEESSQPLRLVVPVWAGEVSVVRALASAVEQTYELLVGQVDARAADANALGTDADPVRLAWARGRLDGARMAVETLGDLVVMILGLPLAREMQDEHPDRADLLALGRDGCWRLNRPEFPRPDGLVLGSLVDAVTFQRDRYVVSAFSLNMRAVDTRGVEQHEATATTHEQRMGAATAFAHAADDLDGLLARMCGLDAAAYAAWLAEHGSWTERLIGPQRGSCDERI